MNQFLSRLTHSERRFVVGVALVLFIVLNLFWVWPHFSDWDNLQGRLNSARASLQNYNAGIQQGERLKPELSKLEGEGASVLPEDQATAFFQTINAHAIQSGVILGGNSRTTTRSSQFFMEQVQTIAVQATEKQLVDFLYNLGSGNSLIRARSLSVHPDPSRMQLSASITLVASYQKNPKVNTGTPAAKSAAPAGTPPTPKSATQKNK